MRYVLKKISRPEKEIPRIYALLQSMQHVENVYLLDITFVPYGINIEVKIVTF